MTTDAPAWAPVQLRRGLPCEALRAQSSDGREYWLRPRDSGGWRLLVFGQNTYLGSSDHPTLQAAQAATQDGA
jgi:hypothetical protein